MQDYFKTVEVADKVVSFVDMLIDVDYTELESIDMTVTSVAVSGLLPQAFLCLLKPINSLSAENSFLPLSTKFQTVFHLP